MISRPPGTIRPRLTRTPLAAITRSSAISITTAVTQRGRPFICNNASATNVNTIVSPTIKKKIVPIGISPAGVWVGRPRCSPKRFKAIASAIAAEPAAKVIRTSRSMVEKLTIVRWSAVQRLLVSSISVGHFKNGAQPKPCGQVKRIRCSVTEKGLDTYDDRRGDAALTRRLANPGVAAGVGHRGGACRKGRKICSSDYPFLLVTRPDEPNGLRAIYRIVDDRQ